MRLSLNAIADIIINSVYSGTKGVANISLSKDQVKDEINLARNRMILDLHRKYALETEGLYQDITCLKATKKDIRQACPVDVTAQDEHKVLAVEIPRLLHIPRMNPVKYLGNSNRQVEWKYFWGNDFIYRKYDKYAKNAPVAWINNTTIWLINPPDFLKKQITIQAIFENPRDLSAYNCCKASDNDPYPVPPTIVDMITGKLINDYLRYYRMQNPQANTGNEFTDTSAENRFIRITTQN